MIYEIGFKSGARIRVDIVDQDSFLEKIRRATWAESSSNGRIFIFEGDNVLVLSEMEYILPLADNVVIVKTPTA